MTDHAKQKQQEFVWKPFEGLTYKLVIWALGALFVLWATAAVLLS